MKQLRTHLALTQFEEVTHTHRQTNTHFIIIKISSLIDNITCEETWPMFFSSMKREQCHRLDSSLSVRFPQVHWKWDFRFLGFHSKCHDFFTRNWKQWFCISGMWFRCHKTASVCIHIFSFGRNSLFGFMFLWSNLTPNIFSSTSIL